jgi:hypothetical protein
MDKIIWIIDERKSSTSKFGTIGKWKIFSTYYDGNTSKDDSTTGRIRLTCFLPGIKKNLGNFQNETEAKEKAETALKYWVKQSEIISFR